MLGLDLELSRQRALALSRWDTEGGAGDAGRSFELRSIYATGWMVVVGSIVLTLVTWIVSHVLGS